MGKIEDFSTNINIINYLKALAIIFVIITHFSFTDEQRTNFIFSYFINMAVPIFMSITAFNNSMSFYAKKVSSLLEMYNIKLFAKRFLRLTIPLLPILILEYLILPQAQKHHFSTLFINGGIGPGSYYYPVMLQIIIVFPLLYFFVKRYALKAVFLIFLLEYSLMSLLAYFDMHNSDFRLIAIRYLSIITLGVYFVLNRQKLSNKVLSMLFVIGLFLITLINYLDCCWPYTLNYWGNKSGIPAALYFTPIIYFTYNYLKDYKLPDFLHFIFEIIGKSSWHIYLTQMIYYSTLAKYIYLNSPLYSIFVNLCFCLTFGVLFYVLNTKFMQNRFIQYLFLKITT